MCGPSHHTGSQGLFTYIQAWPASTTLCLCSRSQKTCQAEHFYYSGMFHWPPKPGCCWHLMCDFSKLYFSIRKPKQNQLYPNCFSFLAAFGPVTDYILLPWGQLWMWVYSPQCYKTLKVDLQQSLAACMCRQKAHGDLFWCYKVFIGGFTVHNSLQCFFTLALHYRCASCHLCAT